MFLKNQNLPIDAKKRQEKKSRKGSTSSLIWWKKINKDKMNWTMTSLSIKTISKSQYCDHCKKLLLPLTLLGQHKQEFNFSFEVFRCLRFFFGLHCPSVWVISNYTKHYAVKIIFIQQTFTGKFNGKLCKCGTSFEIVLTSHLLISFNNNNYW